MRIRLTNKFHGQPAQPIAGDEAPEDGAGWRVTPPNEPQHNIEHDPFESSLVEL